MVGRTPRSAADAPVGLLAPCKMLTALFRQPDAGVTRAGHGSAFRSRSMPIIKILYNRKE